MDYYQEGRDPMNRKHLPVFVVILSLVLALLLSACAEETGDVVVRLAEASPSSDANIAIPGYKKLSFAAGKTAQSVKLKNPPENACAFVLSLTLDDGTTLWTGKALLPGEAFTTIRLSKALSAGRYSATLRYDCYTIEDNQPLNGAEIQLTIEVK